ncbi:MAG: sugar phosphate isomerase/epimerase family protein [Mycetocola sp.]
MTTPTGSIRLAGHTLGTPRHSPVDAIELFAQAGLDGAELIWQDGYLSAIPETDNARLLADIREISTKTGLPIVGLTPYMTGINSLDEAERSRDVDRFTRCIRDAAALGAGVVRVYAGAYSPDQIGIRPQLWEQLVRSLTELAPVAGENGVVLAVENHFNTMTVSAQETIELIEAVQSPAVDILYDQANLTFTHNEDFPRAIELQRGHITHVHAKDLTFVDRDRPFSASAVANVTGEQRAVRSRVIGDGEMDWGAIIAALLTEGYDGVISLEYEYRWHPQDLPEPLEGFSRGAKKLREYLALAEAR